MTRTAMAMALLALGALAPARAAAQRLDIQVEGTYTNELTGEETAWRASTVAEGTALHGILTFRGNKTYERYEVPLTGGALIDGQLTLPFVAPSGVAGVITGRIDGRRASGVYVVGVEHGTWTGTCDRSVR